MRPRSITCTPQFSVPLCIRRRFEKANNFLVALAPVAASGVGVDFLVLVEAVVVLSDTSAGGGQPAITTPSVEPALLNARLLKLTLGEVALSVEALAALDVNVLARVVLGLAGIGAGIGSLSAGVSSALAAVLVVVELERALAEAGLEIVAGHEGNLNASNGVSRAVVVLVGTGLLADIGGVRGNRGGSGRRS